MTVVAELDTTPLRTSITVATSAEHAFDVFTSGFDSWWPRSHHIGGAPLQRAIIEPRAGGRCYSEQIDGTDCPWGTVLQWEPPRRLVIAWQINPQWKYEPDLANSSEVEINFTPLGGESTLVTLEHRNFDRHGAGGATIRKSVAAPTGWADLLGLFAARAEEPETDGASA